MAIVNPTGASMLGSLLGGGIGTTTATTATSAWDPYTLTIPAHTHVYGPQLSYPPPAPVTMHHVMANVRIEKLENGYLVIYSKQGVPEKRRFAADMKEVGDAVIVACTDLALQGDTK